MSWLFAIYYWFLAKLFPYKPVYDFAVSNSCTLDDICFLLLVFLFKVYYKHSENKSIKGCHFMRICLVRISTNSNIHGGWLYINFVTNLIIIFADCELLKKIQIDITLHFQSILDLCVYAIDKCLYTCLLILLNSIKISTTNSIKISTT